MNGLEGYVAGGWGNSKQPWEVETTSLAWTEEDEKVSKLSANVLPMSGSIPENMSKIGPKLWIF